VAANEFLSCFVEVFAAFRCRLFSRGDSNHKVPADHLIVKSLSICKISLDGTRNQAFTDEEIEMPCKESILIEKED